MRYEEHEILGKVKLTSYLLSGEHLDPGDPYGKRPAVLVIPGGGYSFVSEREAEPIAMQFLAQGMHAFVLRYSVNTKFPQSLLETAASVRLIRQNAERWSVDPDRIAVCGFSAGGHLAATLAVFWNRPFLNELLGSRPEEIRPNGAMLCYAVLTSKNPHSGSFRNLLLEDDCPEKRDFLSIEKQVDESTPPCFFWHTFDDPGVPLEGAISVMSALKAKGIPFEAHVWPHGPHGLALGTPETRCGGMDPTHPCAEWPALAARWLRSL